MKNLPRLALLIYGCLILERVLVEFPRATLTLDSVYYALGASRFSEGAFGETFSGPWQPLMAWLAGIQVFLGLDPLTAVVTLSVIGGGLAVVMFTRIAYVMGGWPAALITGAGLASDQRVLFESAAVRSDGLYLGIAAVIFGLLLKPYDRDQGRVELSFFGWCAVLGAILVALRVAALPVVGFIGLCLLFGYKISRKARTIGVVVFSAAVGLVLGVFCLFYYRRFGVFVPSLNFVLNKFLLIAEWSKTDPEAFCRLYDGKNTMLADLQFLDPSVRTLPVVPPIDPLVIANYRSQVLPAAYIVGSHMVGPYVWAGVGLGIVALVKRRWNKFLGFVFLWTLFSCGAQLFSTIQYRFFLPMIGPLYLLAGLGVSYFVPREWKGFRVQYLAALLFILNVWAGRVHMNPGYLLSGKWVAGPVLVGDYIKKTYGAGRTIMAIGAYPSLIRAHARFKTVPCVGTDQIEAYIQDKRVEFVIIPKPIDQYAGPTVQAIVTRPGSLLDLEQETDHELLYRVKGGVDK